MRNMVRVSFVLPIAASIISVWPASPAGASDQTRELAQRSPSSQRGSLDPDLVIKVKGQEGLLVYPGFPLKDSVKVVLSNNGAKDAQNFDVDIFLTQSRSSLDKSQLLSRIHVPALKGNTSVELPLERGFKIPEDAPFRTLYIVAAADSGQTVKEADERNNAGILSIQVQINITNAGQCSDGDCLDLRGAGFGSSAGSKKVYLDALPQDNPNISWSPTRIFIGNTTEDMPFGQNYTVTIKSNGSTISNSVVIFMKCRANYFNPQQGQAGTTVHLAGLGFGQAQGGKILKLGTVPVTGISSWTYHEIVCQIPTGLAPGQYFFSVWENGSQVSIAANLPHEAFTIL